MKWAAVSFIGLLCLAGLSACASEETYAPVADISGYEAVIAAVAAPTRLHSEVRSAAASQVLSPHVAMLKPGLPRRFAPRNDGSGVATRNDGIVATGWRWPAHGTVLAVFSNQNKGVDIGAAAGTPVYAALAGKVVYAGHGLRGYGNLIILKHNSQYLSAYAFNKRLFVKQGEWVKSGQRIATMGLGPLGKPELHFEIRRAGVPVNPLNLL